MPVFPEARSPRFEGSAWTLLLSPHTSDEPTPGVTTAVHAVVHERSHHQVRCAAAAADERRDEYAGIAMTTRIPQRRARGARCALLVRDAFRFVLRHPANARVVSKGRLSMCAFKAGSTTVALLARPRLS
jgi:hypothetical protein